MKIRWAGFATTKGRQVYASTLDVNYIPNHAINYNSGFLIGWDRWSDGRFDLAPGLFVPEAQS